MQGPADHARGWFRKAESDLRTAERMLESDGPFDTACFHAQQAAEKFIKGLFAFSDREIPRTHNLEELACRIQQGGVGLDLSDTELAELTPFAVQMRYDVEFWPAVDEAQGAFEIARKVRETVYALVPPAAQPDSST